EEQVIGCVARFDPVKNHDVLVRAMKLVTARHPNAALLLVGDGPRRPVIDRLVGELGVRVVSPGVIGPEANAYSSCDLYVSASSKEGLPLASLEAMASGLAVVATDVPGHRDVVERDTTGLLVATSGGADALAAGIASLLDDPERRQRMGRAGRARVLKE